MNSPDVARARIRYEIYATRQTYSTFRTWVCETCVHHISKPSLDFSFDRSSRCHTLAALPPACIHAPPSSDLESKHQTSVIYLTIEPCCYFRERIRACDAILVANRRFSRPQKPAVPETPTYTQILPSTRDWSPNPLLTYIPSKHVNELATLMDPSRDTPHIFDAEYKASIRGRTEGPLLLYQPQQPRTASHSSMIILVPE